MSLQQLSRPYGDYTLDLGVISNKLLPAELTSTNSTEVTVKYLCLSACLSLQAYHWYELGHQHGHFASVWQRSLYNVDGLKAQPWWTPKETGYTDLVKVRAPAEST